MKVLILLALILASAFSAAADPVTIEELWSHLFTNGPILWQAPTHQLPKHFWIYQRRLPRVFSETIISNAIVLTPYQYRGIPQPSTKDTCIEDDPDCNCGCVRSCNFSIRPKEATLSFDAPNPTTSTNNLPSEADIVSRAWQYAAQLGVDRAQVVTNGFVSRFNWDTNNGKITNQICGRGIFLCRQLDGIPFFSPADEDTGAEGFAVEFGSYGLIRSFSLCWSDLVRNKSEQTASQRQIITGIRAHKAIVLPDPDEADFFARLKILADAKKLTITKITPYYGEGMFGEVPTNGVHCEFVMPFAELEAVADFGSSNMAVRLVSPILSSEVNRLLKSQ
jgi:hypothetical protein